MNELRDMVNETAAVSPELRPAQWWEEINKSHLEDLHQRGYKNFKRTVSWLYFQWMIHPWHPYSRFLIKNLPFSSVLKNTTRALRAGSRHASFSWKGTWSYNFFTYMLWDYASKNDLNHDLDRLTEPREGNPLQVSLDGRLISQDLANAVLEYRSMMNSKLRASGIQTVIELGGGYGRTAFIFLTLQPKLKYIMVDFPPALYIAQRYLCNQFPQKKAFRFRTFSDYREIKDDFEKADLAFFLPHQIDCLPDRSSDLFINISSFHEMRPEQIDYYFARIDRLTRYFYFKEKKDTLVLMDNIRLLGKDYPVRERWSQIFWRDCQVQTDFFEALFQVHP